MEIQIGNEKISMSGSWGDGLAVYLRIYRSEGQIKNWGPYFVPLDLTADQAISLGAELINYGKQALELDRKEKWHTPDSTLLDRSLLYYSPITLLQRCRKLWDGNGVEQTSERTWKDDLRDDIDNFIYRETCCETCNECREDCTCDDDKHNQNDEDCACDIVLGGRYHDGVVYATGYAVDDGAIELDDKLFTTFDTGISGGVAGELDRLRANFNPSNDIRRFAVALKTVKIIDDKYDDSYCGNCDQNGNNCTCLSAIAVWPVCCQNWEDCPCDDDEDYCDECGSDYDDCECEYCCGEEGCLCNPNNDNLNEEFASDTFRPMNAFTRARWIKARNR